MIDEKSILSSNMIVFSKICVCHKIIDEHIIIRVSIYGKKINIGRLDENRFHLFKMILYIDLFYDF